MNGLDERLGLAMRLGLAQGRWDDAIGEVRSTLVDHSASPKALLALGVCYFHRREFAEAITWLDQAEARARRGANRGRERGYEQGPERGREERHDEDEVPRAPIHLFRGMAYAARRAPAAARAEFAELRAFGPTPIRWESFDGVLRPDELARARLAAESAGLPKG